jgi:hypothetical protein
VKYFNNKVMKEKNILERMIEGCKRDETMENTHVKD